MCKWTVEIRQILISTAIEFYTIFAHFPYLRYFSFSSATHYLRSLAYNVVVERKEWLVKFKLHIFTIGIYALLFCIFSIIFHLSGLHCSSVARHRLFCSLCNLQRPANKSHSPIHLWRLFNDLTRWKSLSQEI